MPYKKLIQSCSIFFVGFVMCLGPGFAADSVEYDELTVLLLDAKEGLIGVHAEATGKTPPRKLSFKIDAKATYITNPLNQELSLEDIQIGDHITIYAERLPSGHENVVEIVDYDRFIRE